MKFKEKFLTFLRPFVFQAMAKFYTASSQAKELCDEAKAVRMKNKELKDEFLLKKGKVIRLTEELTRLQAIEKELRNQVEELKVDSIEKETRINHLEVKFQGFTSSLKNAKKEDIATFMKSDDFTNRLDQRYVAGYEDFHSDVKEATLGWTLTPLKFLLQHKVPYFKRALRTSTSWTMPQLSLSKTSPSSPRTIQILGTMPLVVYLSNIHFLRKI